MTLLEVDLLLRLRFLQFFYHLKSQPIWREYIKGDIQNLESLEDESAAYARRKVKIDLHCRFLSECSRSPYRLN